MNLKNIFTIIKKELLQYFTSFSNFLVLAAVSAVVIFLFFNSFYALNTSQLDNLFGLFPWVFALLVPAVTMGVIAQERKTKTLHYLTASPITELEVVLGKFMGALIFLSIFLFSTLLIPISLKSVAMFDWGIVAGGFIASLILLAFFLSIDLLVSSLFTNQLAAFVLSFLVNFLLIILGTDMINQLIPHAFLQFVFPLSPLDHFSSLSQGLINFSDLAYFILVIAGFLVLAWWRLMVLKLPENKQAILTRGISIHALALALLVGGYFTYLIPGQIDISAQQVFTLANGTYEILQDLNEPVIVDVYLSKNLPPAFQPRLQDLQRLLEQLSVAGSDKLQVNKRYPQEDTQVQQDAMSVGIYPQAFSVVSQTEYQAKEGYLGLNIKFKESNQVIPFIARTEGLEYQLMSLVYDLTREQKLEITYLQSENGPALETESSYLSQELSATYEVKTVNLPSQDAESRLKKEDLVGGLLILTEVNGAIHPDDIALIKKMVDEEGKSLLVFEDGIDLNVQFLSATKSEQVFVNELLKDWGMLINQDLVYDLKNANLLTFTTQQGRVLISYPFWPTVEVNQDIPLLKDIGTVVLPWSSSIGITEDQKVKPLLSTSQFAGVASEAFDLSPEQQFKEDALAVRYVGAIRSRSEQKGAVIVVATPNLIKDQFVTQGNNNLLFAIQLFDLATQSESLASIRVKNRIPPTLMFATPQQKVYLRYFNLGGGPMVVLLIGGVFLYQRRKISLRKYDVA